MRKFALGIAAVALAATGAYAQPGNGNGNGQGKGPDKQMNGPAAKGPDKQRGNPSNGPGNGNAKNDRGPDRVVQQDRGGPGNANRGNGNQKVDRGNGNAGNGNAMADRGKPDKFDARGGPGNDKAFKDNARGNDRDDYRYADRRYDDRRDGYGIFDRYNDDIRSRGLVDGCPPGLAKKNNGCNPPGLVKRDERRYDRADWWGLPGLLDGRYRYYDGNLVRLGDNGILGYYPLLGGALSIGNQWPSWYDSRPLPSYYENYYGLGGNYRYADNAIYRLDPETAAITSIAALLTGDNIRVGQPMPSGYSVYNVPYGYRDRYYDSPDRMYRYSDGYVYEIDPTTMLVASAIDLVL